MTFKEYTDAGWVLCDVQPGTKGPRAKGWNLKANGITDAPASMVGAGLCHAYSGTCVLDVDALEQTSAWLEQIGIDLYELINDKRAVRPTSGRPDRVKMLYSLPTPMASIKLAPYKVKDEKGVEKTYHAFELRCATADGASVQDVLPPTIHPGTGRPYTWEYGDEMTGHWSNPPPLPAKLLELWQNELSKSVKPAGGALQSPVGAKADEIRKLLKDHDPATDYNSWISVGMAIHHESQASEEGLALWAEWSIGFKDYPGIEKLTTHWRSFKLNSANPVTLGSLRRTAIAAPEEFPVTAPTEADVGTDTRPGAVAKRLLESRLVLITGQSSYFDMESNTGELLTDYTIRHLFCPRMPIIRTETKTGVKVTKIDPIEFLRESPTKHIASSIGLHPGAPQLYEEDDMKFVNLYKPRVVGLLEPRPDELETFEFLWSRMPDPVFRKWLMQFFAHALQKPGVKIRSAPLLWSHATGTGKNTIMRVIPGLLFGNKWISDMSPGVLASNFNDQLGSTWWLYLEEMRAGSDKHERVACANRIKSWVTDDIIQVHPKGKKPYQMRNRLQLTATSNFDNAMQIDNTDRRWAICEMASDAMTEAQSNEAYKFLNGDRAEGVLRYIFSRVSLTGFNPSGRAPVTADKKVMVKAGLGTLESTLITKMVNGETPFHRDVFELADVHRELIGHHLSLHALARILQSTPFNCTQMGASGNTRHWAWRNAKLWKRIYPARRTAYVQGGVRPGTMLPWSDDIPPQIQDLAIDETKVATELEIPDSCADLF